MLNGVRTRVWRAAKTLWRDPPATMAEDALAASLFLVTKRRFVAGRQRAAYASSFSHWIRLSTARATPAAAAGGPSQGLLP